MLNVKDQLPGFLMGGVTCEIVARLIVIVTKCAVLVNIYIATIVHA